MQTNILTFYRFIAASVVVIFHFGRDTSLGLLAPGFFASGPEMVTLFFVLSGFIMALTSLGKESFSKNKYWLNRFSRIYPMYFIAALAMIIFFDDRDLANNPWAILLQATMLQAWLPPYPLTVNVPAWSLSVEAFFYAIFPLIVLFIDKAKPSAKQFLSFSVFLWAFTQLIHINLLNQPNFANSRTLINFLVWFFPLSHLCSFMLGIAGYFLLAEHKQLLGNKWVVNMLLPIALLLVFMVLSKKVGISNRVGLSLPFEASLLSPLFLFLIMVSVKCNNVFTRFFSLRPFIILGEASYAIYILQKPVREFYFDYLYPYQTFQDMTYEQNFYVLFVLLMVLSIVSTYIIEIPTKFYLRKIFK